MFRLAGVVLVSLMVRVGQVPITDDPTVAYRFLAYVRPYVLQESVQFVRILNPKTNWSIVTAVEIRSSLPSDIDVGVSGCVLSIIGAQDRAHIQLQEVHE